MKNIHVLPTKKPSRLQLQMNGNFHIENGQTVSLRSYQNIYITSDEEIKEGDWCMYLGLSMTSFKVIEIEGDKLFYGSRECFNESLCKKIILTTDQYLIKDGVQEIPDKFLEWFVKNPSCERIEFTPYLKDIIDPVTNIKYPSVQFGHFDDTKMIFRYHYELIVPKDNELKIGDNTNFGIVTDINEKSVCFGKNKIGVDVWYKKSDVIKFPKLVLEEPTEKTLEEASSRVLYNKYPYHPPQDSGYWKDMFKEGYKFAQQQMYSEKEVPNKLDSVLAKITHQNDLGLSQWYEVVYYADGKWCSYSGSKTFEDGERVVEWKYCKEIF